MKYNYRRIVQIGFCSVQVALSFCTTFMIFFIKEVLYSLMIYDSSTVIPFFDSLANPLACLLNKFYFYTCEVATVFTTEVL
jgi:hypothetical protein